MDPVHEGVHGPGPQGWSMDLGAMFVYVCYTNTIIHLRCTLTFPFGKEYYRVLQVIFSDSYRTYVFIHQNKNII